MSYNFKKVLVKYLNHLGSLYWRISSTWTFSDGCLSKDHNNRTPSNFRIRSNASLSLAHSPRARLTLHRRSAPVVLIKRINGAKPFYEVGVRSSSCLMEKSRVTRHILRHVDKNSTAEFQTLDISPWSLYYSLSLWVSLLGHPTHTHTEKKLIPKDSLCIYARSLKIILISNGVQRKSLGVSALRL